MNFTGSTEGLKVMVSQLTFFELHPAISASVKGRKEELDKLDTELEKALKHTSTMTEAEQLHNTENPVRLGTNQANTEVHKCKCAIQVKSVQSTLSHLITTSVLRAMFTHFLVEHGSPQYYLYTLGLNYIIS